MVEQTEGRSSAQLLAFALPVIMQITLHPRSSLFSIRLVSYINQLINQSIKLLFNDTVS